MNHSFSQIMKHIISKWYIVLIGVVIIFGCSYLALSQAPDNTTTTYRAVVVPGQYVDHANLLKADYDGYMTLIQSNEVIQAVLDSEPLLKENLSITNVNDGLKINKYNTVNIEILFTHKDSELGKKFMDKFFGSVGAVGILKLNAVYDETYPDYPKDPSKPDSQIIKRGDAKLVNPAVFSKTDTEENSILVDLIIYTVIGLIVLLILMVLPFLFRRVDYVEDYLVEDFDTVILGSINKIEVKKQ